MNPVHLIEKKKRGEELTREELSFLIEGFLEEVPEDQKKVRDFHLGAWLMAVYFQGMTDREAGEFTLLMAKSGDMVDLSPIKGFKIDKHSTGGVGDTTTLILTPLVAAAGVPVAKMSGRGLGHTGGTLDKLESIPNFNIFLEKDRFFDSVNDIGLAVIGQTAKIAPADKKLYALRDVTGTVDSIPLIASSIMSKKLAAGADGILLDVKTGSGAFMVEYEASLELAQKMVGIGHTQGRKMMGVITNMEEPLGNSIGNMLEVKEAIDILKGKGPEDKRLLCIYLGGLMLQISGRVETLQQGMDLIKEKIQTGEGLAKLREMVINQGGDPACIDDPEKFKKADHLFEVKSQQKGFVNKLNALELGIASMELGAGRITPDDIIDLSVGIILHKKIGDEVNPGDVLATIHYNDEKKMETCKKRLIAAYQFSSEKPKAMPLIYSLVTPGKVEDVNIYTGE